MGAGFCGMASIAFFPKETFCYDSKIVLHSKMMSYMSSRSDRNGGTGAANNNVTLSLCGMVTSGISVCNQFAAASQKKSLEPWTLVKWSRRALAFSTPAQLGPPERTEESQESIQRLMMV